MDRAVVMGVLNVTPDSFSDGGRFLEPATAIARGKALAAAGTRWAPGLVDSPPTSTMSAPPAASCRPLAIAAAASR